MRDIEELDRIVAAEVTFVPCDTLDDVLREALVRETTVCECETQTEEVRTCHTVREENVPSAELPTAPTAPSPDRVYTTVSREQGR